MGENVEENKVNELKEEGWLFDEKMITAIKGVPLEFLQDNLKKAGYRIEGEQPPMGKMREEFKSASHVKLGREFLERLVKIAKKYKAEDIRLNVKNDYPVLFEILRDDGDAIEMVVAPRIEENV